MYLFHMQYESVYGYIFPKKCMYSINYNCYVHVNAYEYIIGHISILGP